MMIQIDELLKIEVQAIIGCRVDSMLKTPDRVMFEKEEKLEFWAPLTINRFIILGTLHREMYGDPEFN
jgi:hypothetical protein